MGGSFSTSAIAPHSNLEVDPSAGNSGGPAFNKKGECVGIAFQVRMLVVGINSMKSLACNTLLLQLYRMGLQTLKSADTENIGWVIPTPVVAHFLTDFEQNSKFTGLRAG